MSYNELTNQGNVRWSALPGGGIRLDVHTQASLQVLEVLTDLVDAETVDVNVLDANLIREGGARIVARGSNANGEYVRFADGTQICWVTDRAWTTDANGNDSWTFPAAFVALPACWGQALGTSYDVREFRGSSGTSSMRVKMINSAGNNYSSQSVSAHLFAIGRWK